MLSAIPPIGPHDTHDLWYNSSSTQSFQQNQSDDPHHNHHQRQSHHDPSAHARTPHSILRADEQAIQTRKLNIRRFGAGWLRPPGVSKTLQAIEDELLEREEQEATALRDQAFAEAEALAEREAAEAAANGMGPDLDEGIEDRDLDDDIPSAPASPLSPGSAASAADEWADEIEVSDQLPQEEGDGDYAENNNAGDVSGMGGGGGMLGEEERDLDDDVPDAGSYQHTDTDLEDDSSEEENERDHWGVGGGHGAARSSVGSAMAAAAHAVGLGSSVFGSSPVVTPARRSSGRRSSGRTRRGTGREN